MKRFDRPLAVHPFRAAALVPLALALLAGCGGPGAEDTSDAVPSSTSAMHLISCTLACNGPVAGPVGCTITEVFVNQSLSFEFNRPVDPASLSPASLRVSKFSDDDVPPALIQVDPANPRRVVYTPRVTFDDDGNVVPGFESGESYRVVIRGAATGPRITSVSGSSNITSVDCFVVASKGILDLQPGPPSVQVLVEEIAPATGQVLDSYPADGATDVDLDSRVRLQFDQILDASTLIDTSEGTSPTVQVRFDKDGDPNTTDDQVPLPGTYSVQFDDVSGTTALYFRPQPRLPSAGSNPLEIHRVVVSVNSSISDLGGEPLGQSVSALFTPLAVPVPSVLVRDTFQGIKAINVGASSALAEPTTLVGGDGLRGRVVPVLAGGSGRHGELFVRNGETVVLGTGPTLVTRFGPELTTNGVDAFGVATTDEDEIVAYEVRAQPIDDYVVDGVLPGELAVEVDDGVFEFATLVIDAGGRLVLEGANPARIFVRGVCRVEGTLDAGGRDAIDQASTVGLGGDGGPNRLGAGAGGDGGDRPDQPTNGQLTPSQGQAFRGYDHPPGTSVVVDGTAGGGRGGAAAGTVGAGGGGVAWPPVMPGPSILELGSIADTNYLNALCASVIVGAPGAGASHVTSGTEALWSVPSAAFGVPIEPPLAPVDADLVRAFEVLLDPDRGGQLVGGAGGGGGGGGIQGTTTNGVPTNSCIPVGAFPLKRITAYLDASGAAGGGGGGALQLHVGGSLQASGSISVAGGDGGGFPLCTVPTMSDDCWAAPGGGGSGGALLIQARELELGTSTDVFDVSGGSGGFNANTLSEGGHGGVGMIHVELPVAPSLAEIATRLEPDVGGVGEPALADVILTAALVDPTTGPARRSGFTSCWIVPDGGLFGFDFVEDDLTSVDPAEWVFGWNAKIELDTGEVVDWRGDSGPITTDFGSDFETLVGSSLDSSPLVVRFQGIRFASAVASPCESDLAQIGATFVPDSLTPWVEHPDELNSYWALIAGQSVADQRRPNALRAQFVIDPDAPFADRIASVVEFQVLVQPR
ncbi:hypothetical protein Pla163_28530 [Planctomycetes bacterium Pla163]|uniref:SbsA Ig-like domain-containing protein n=1 Tax=Rohdeia mirabilis TaxID=2528008 RepID=A0A518D2L5_9BACT|nr:hypothetical protein Pla163_28530 [Planctomycetes bacterium Pla163]